MEKKDNNRTIEKVAANVVKGYKKIEEGAVSGYKKIENGAVKGFENIKDAFIKRFFMRGGETLDDAKKRPEDEAAVRTKTRR